MNWLLTIRKTLTNDQLCVHQVELNVVIGHDLPARWLLGQLQTVERNRFIAVELKTGMPDPLNIVLLNAIEIDSALACALAPSTDAQRYTGNTAWAQEL
jgi:hypothetical protein